MPRRIKYLTNRDTSISVNPTWIHDKKVDKITAENSGICYPMELTPSYIVGLDGEFIKTPDCYRVRSLDDGLPIGGAVAAGHGLVSNQRMFDLIENSLAGTDHKIVKVGTRNNRSKVIISVQFSDEFIEAGGRKTETCLNFMFGHGGKFGILMKAGFRVPACMNEFDRLVREESSYQRAMRHTTNVEARLVDMGKSIEKYCGVVAEFKAVMDSLASQFCDTSKAERIFAGFLFPTVPDETDGRKYFTRSENQVRKLTELFHSGRGNDGNDLSDVFNAFTDYYTHSSSGGKDAWKQLESSEFGAGARAKAQAYDLLRGKTVRQLGSLSDVINRGDKVLQLINN